MRLETRTGPSPETKPNKAQITTPEVNITYIPSEMPEVSWVRRVWTAWGKKLDVVRIAATYPRASVGETFTAKQ